MHHGNSDGECVPFFLQEHHMKEHGMREHHMRSLELSMRRREHDNLSLPLHLRDDLIEIPQKPENFQVIQCKNEIRDSRIFCTLVPGFRTLLVATYKFSSHCLYIIQRLLPAEFQIWM